MPFIFLAAMVGTATESVIRTPSDFREEGLIKFTALQAPLSTEKS
ncbi:MAG: winged helix-turn-helix domain-containing protein [Bacteroidetes bacterium]|nr:winged helix-turn-helix domain-containing protein [Bacteroidota bacterium]